jgi:hypothetical protein
LRRRTWWVRYSLQRNVVVTTTVLGSGFLQAIERYDVFLNQSWIHSTSTQLGSVSVASFAVLLNTVGDAIIERSRRIGEDRRIDLRKPVISALAVISQQTGIFITELGANVFLLAGRGAKRRLERVERVRLSDNPPMSNIKWTYGKGVVGRCWANGRPEYFEWKPIADRWAGKDITDEQFEAMRELHKQGLDKQEFMAMVAKYAEIYAVPIRDEFGQFIGCLTFDRQWRPDDPRRELLRGPWIEDLAATTASVLQSVLTGR